MQLWLDLVKPITSMLDACVNGHWQASSDLVYSSLPPYKSKPQIILVRVNDVKGSCKDATMIRSC